MLWFDSKFVKSNILVIKNLAIWLKYNSVLRVWPSDPERRNTKIIDYKYDVRLCNPHPLIQIIHSLNSKQKPKNSNNAEFSYCSDCHCLVLHLLHSSFGKFKLELNSKYFFIVVDVCVEDPRSQ